MFNHISRLDCRAVKPIRGCVAVGVFILFSLEHKKKTYEMQLVLQGKGNPAVLKQPPQKQLLPRFPPPMPPNSIQNDAANMENRARLKIRILERLKTGFAPNWREPEMRGMV